MIHRAHNYLNAHLPRSVPGPVQPELGMMACEPQVRIIIDRIGRPQYVGHQNEDQEGSTS